MGQYRGNDLLKKVTKKVTKKATIVLLSLTFITGLVTGCGTPSTASDSAETQSAKVNEVVKSTEEKTTMQKESGTDTTEVTQNQTQVTDVAKDQTSIAEKGTETIETSKNNNMDPASNSGDNTSSTPVINNDVPVADIHLTLGSSKEDVISALGNPYSITKADDALYVYMYCNRSAPIRTDPDGKKRLFMTYSEDFPCIFMRGTETDQHIAGWNDAEGTLKISIGEKTSSPKVITLGSTKQDVIETVGTPPSYIPYDDSSSMMYNRAECFFIDMNEKVTGWKNTGLCTTYIEKDPSAPPIKVGSSTQDIGRAMGTPIVLTIERWEYKEGRINLDINTGKVKSWTVFAPGLKVE